MTAGPTAARSVLGLVLGLALVRTDPRPAPGQSVRLRDYTVAEGAVDVDGDGRPDLVRITAPRAVRHVDEEPCSGCGDRVHGEFFAVVSLTGHGRTVRSRARLHSFIEGLEFEYASRPSPLAFADYERDGRPDFNLGQYTNSCKWEYGLFSLAPDGRVTRTAQDKPEIYVSPGGEPSTRAIEALPSGGIRFVDFGNAGDKTGFWEFTCPWDAAMREFRCTSRPVDAALVGAGSGN